MVFIQPTPSGTVKKMGSNSQDGDQALLLQMLDFYDTRKLSCGGRKLWRCEAEKMAAFVEG